MPGAGRTSIMEPTMARRPDQPPRPRPTPSMTPEEAAHTLARDPALRRARRQRPVLGARAAPLSPAERELQMLLAELETRAMEQPVGGLRLFVQHAWPILEPAAPFVPGYHVDAICAHLEAITNGELRDLLVLMPPRFGKSLLIGVFFPAFEWGPANQPSLKSLFNTYRLELSLRDSNKRRQLMAHAWYQRRWGSRFTLSKDRFRADNAIRYENDRAGFHFSTAVSGGNIGEGGDRLFADDPNNLAEIHFEAAREAVIRWWCEVMSTRRNTAQAARIVVQQRGHERDLAGALLAQGGYTVLRLPNEYSAKTHCTTRWWNDPRTQEGELLCPARLSADQTDDLKRSLGDAAYQAQFQQHPAPPGGGIWKDTWWRYWVPADHPLVGTLDTNGRPILGLPARFDQTIQTWDLSFKKTTDGSYVCGGAWGRRGALAYLLTLVRDRMGMTETLRAIKQLAAQYPHQAIYVEDKANGPAVLDLLYNEIPGLLPAGADVSKEARAYAAQPRVQAGNFVLPHPSLAPWVPAFLHETRLFPNSANDDQVDMTTIADQHLFLVKQFSTSNFHQGVDHGI